MKFFESIEGLKGENLTTAVLHYLILRSQDIRKNFIDLLSEKSKVGPFSVHQHFSCIREWFTEHDKKDTGYLDLLIETDDTVVGIENKIDAGFQPRQLEKYIPALKERRNDLQKIRSSSMEFMLMVLAPQSRKEEIEREISQREEEKEKLAFIAWEDVLGGLNSLKNRLDPETATILTMLNEYIEDRTGWLPDFKKNFPHYGGTFQPRGSTIQREMVGKLWYFFPKPGRRLSSGDTWVGYYFSGDNWYGFIPTNEIKDETKHRSELIVALSHDLVLRESTFRRISLISKEFLGTGECFVWIINFSKEWETKEDWNENVVKPLQEGIDGMKGQT